VWVQRKQPMPTEVFLKTEMILHGELLILLLTRFTVAPEEKTPKGICMG
jgi:hypothetical protein